MSEMKRGLQWNTPILSSGLLHAEILVSRQARLNPLDLGDHHEVNWVGFSPPPASPRLCGLNLRALPFRRDTSPTVEAALNPRVELVSNNSASRRSISLYFCLSRAICASNSPISWGPLTRGFSFYQ